MSHGRLDDARSPSAAATALLADLPQRAAVLGFSLGGIVALEMARLAPDRIAGLALVNSTARPLDPALHDDRRGEVERARQCGMAVFARETVLRHIAQPLDPADGALLLAMAESAGANRFADQTELAVSRRDARPLLPSLAMPSLVVGGDRDTINDPAVQAELAAALPNTTLAVIAGSGHFTPIEQPELLAPHVADWLARVDRAQYQQVQEDGQ